MEIFGYASLLDDIEAEFRIRVVSNLEEIEVDGVILALAHRVFQAMTMDKLRGIMSDRPILIDVRVCFDIKEVAEKDFITVLCEN